MSNATLMDRFILGTAQLGLSYGIANQSGKPSRQAAIDLVHQAIAGGVRVLDTARVYGDSEEVLCAAMADLRAKDPDLAAQVSIITKITTPLADEARAMSDRDLADLARAGVEQSCQALGVKTLPTLLIREAWPLEKPNGFWDALRHLQDQGVIGTLGLSAQAAQEAALAAEVAEVQHLQIPFNLLDYRWRRSGAFDRLAARSDMTVHVRSIYLQGLLVGGPAVSWPAQANGLGPQVGQALEQAKNTLGRRSLADLCLAYVLSYPFVRGAVLGVETPDQLADNLALLACPPLSEAQRSMVDDLLPQVPEALLNPGLWS